jgi:NADH:ubiquinone reductase (H+-translocating)
LEAAKALSRVPVDITLLDQQNHHCFQPLLYQVATAALSPADVAWPIRSILSAQRNVRVVMAEVVAVDRARRVVETSIGQSYSFDYLVLATGATHSYFGHDDWAAFAPGLKRIEDAVEIRRRILLAYERAEIEQDASARSKLLTFAIIGGGPTGVEMAGAIADTARLALSRDFRRIDTRDSRIVLLEAGPRLLSALSDQLSDYAYKSLQRMGVEVRTSTPVIDCRPEGVVTPRETIRTGSIIWAAGVRASNAAAWLGAEADRAGRVIVEADLSLPGDRSIFVVGDTAHVATSEGHVVPGIAPAAKQMGKYVGDGIKARVNGQAKGAFVYKHYGDLATIGRKSAVVSLGRFRLTGFAAWLFWSVVHVYYLIGARNRMIVALNWIWDYVAYQRGARLINENARFSLHPQSSTNIAQSRT